MAAFGYLIIHPDRSQSWGGFTGTEDDFECAGCAWNAGLDESSDDDDIISLLVLYSSGQLAAHANPGDVDIEDEEKYCSDCLDADEEEDDDA